MIGYLQKINTNDHIGGELEGTLTMSFFRGATLRRWLRRPDCPEIVQQFRAIFERTFSPQAGTSPPLVQDGDRAHYMYNGTNYSRASTHVGNSILMYYPTAAADTPIPGSIERIISKGSTTSFVIRRYAPLSPGQFDPFSRYRPHFPAFTYSSKFEDVVDTIDPSLVLSHCARFEFSDNRAVLLNLSRG
ncbi:hypothetical protein GGX14DRAFT_382951 [Mycena pura]|uniref:Uncharacterized protein n=1 Tax=Mycena pura TaxID=153505 RepID=A0AAD6URH1_9AGAR|nr:hypothetical protein GGX14DRAFT_383590 [Mycena pura]KAJ7189700.1 hypothetical protein GGX14DRAFT_382951 [Mycena pura]